MVRKYLIIGQRYKKTIITNMKCFLFGLNLLVVLTLAGCSSGGIQNRTDYLNNSQFLTATVYNATVGHLEEKEIIQDDHKDFKSRDHEFRYDQIKVFQGYAFKVILDSNLEPYFGNDYIGEEIEVIISFFGLHSESNDAWYDQKMIIFKTNTEIVGFLTGNMGIINELNPFTIQLDNLYFFSSHFLTENEVIKHYQKGDRLYTFIVNLRNEEKIDLEIKSELAFVSEPVTLTSTVVQGTFMAIDSEQVLDIMELTTIEKIDFKATITGIDPVNHLLYVTSNEESTLETVAYKTFYDLEGNEFSEEHLNIGDVIRIYYFKRYSTYQPIDLRVDDIIVE